jgi:glutaredoxin
MKRTTIQTRSALLAITALLALAAPSLQAQAIFRIVGPDGRVTFSDQPPAPTEKATALSPSGRASSATSSTTEAGGLPFELRQLANKYPVTLYTGDNCEPCNTGRAMLTARGIPFNERTVTTPQDAEALQRVSGQNSLPVLTIGGQRLNGFWSSEWNQYLDAAGYPQQSKLPSGYRNPPPSPVAPPPKPIEAPVDATQANAPADTEPLPPPAPAPDNPAGIRF